MKKNHVKTPVLYVPDSPNIGAAEPSGATRREHSSSGEKRADDLAAKVATGDELSGYEKVAGRGVPRG